MGSFGITVNLNPMTGDLLIRGEGTDTETGQAGATVRLIVTPWTAAHQASLSITISQNLLKLMSTESVMPSNHLILCHPLQYFPASVFSNESALCIRWPNIGASASASVIPMNIQD